MKPKVIAIVGPTASGKSALGIFLAQKIGGPVKLRHVGAEIISADSRQVYKGLNIGTGKVTRKEMAGIPHHLLSIASPKRQFSADDFVRLADKACSSVLQNTNLPIVVGGTGFYIDMLLGRMTMPAVPLNQKLRERLERQTIKRLFAQLKKLDPRRAETIEPKHKRRLIRAIEIAKAIGKSPLPQPVKKYDVLWLGLAPTEKKLKQNIRTRLLLRMKAGMVAEARQLHTKGLSYKRMEELGLEYRFLSQLLQKKVTEKEMTVMLERAIQKYSKRQMRWFKRNPDIRWVKNKTEALQLAKAFLSR